MIAADLTARPRLFGLQSLLGLSTYVLASSFRCADCRARSPQAVGRARLTTALPPLQLPLRPPRFVACSLPAQSWSLSNATTTLPDDRWPSFLPSHRGQAKAGAAALLDRCPGRRRAGRKSRADSHLHFSPALRPARLFLSSSSPTHDLDSTAGRPTRPPALLPIPDRSPELTALPSSLTVLWPDKARLTEFSRGSTVDVRPSRSHRQGHTSGVVPRLRPAHAAPSSRGLRGQ